MNRAVLLSVRPRFAQTLLDGTKTAEIRRRFPNVPAGTTIVIYSSSPDKAVLGTMRVRSFIHSTAAEIWRDYSTTIGIDKAELTDYLDGATECSVLKLDEPQTWDIPVPLDELRRVLHLEPAQSFRYLNSRQFTRLAELATASAKAAQRASHVATEAIPILV